MNKNIIYTIKDRFYFCKELFYILKPIPVLVVHNLPAYQSWSRFRRLPPSCYYPRPRVTPAICSVQNEVSSILSPMIKLQFAAAYEHS